MKRADVSKLARSGLAVALVCIGVLSLTACGSDGAKGPKGPKGDTGADWPGPLPEEYVAADGLAGGAAYSQWYNTFGGGSGAASEYDVTVNAEFVRCKTCHAWDGVGNAASYADRTGLSTGTATRPDVSSANLRGTAASSTPDELFDLIASPYGRPLNVAGNAHPDFTAALSNAQIWNLVKFMREEWVNPNDLYALSVTGAAMHWEYSAATTSWVLKKPKLTFSSIGTDGNAGRGNTIYTEKCGSCHGANGKTILLETNTMSLGEFVRSKPHEAWFKVKFGNGAASMPPGMVTSTTDLKDLYKAFTDTVDFPNEP